MSNRQNYESQIGVRYAPIASDADGNDYAKVKINGLVYYLSELIHAAFPKSGGYHGDDAQIDHITGIKSDNRPCNLRSVTPAVNVQSSYDIDDNRRSSVEKLGRKIRAFKPTSLIEGGDDAVAYFPSIRAASKATGTRMGFISNQCNGDASGTSRQGWRFEAVAFVPRKDDAGNDEVFRDIAVTSKGLYCAVNRRRATWEEFLPPIIWSHSERSGSSRKRRGRVDDDDDDEAELLSAASVPSWAQSTTQATASRTSPRR